MTEKNPILTIDVKNMQAFVINRYGGPSVMELREMPRPVPRANELLVRVRSAGLNPVDYKFREGQLRPIYRPKLPVILGNELSGTVVGLGSEVRNDSLENFSPGDRIFVRGHKAELGAFAEYACVPAELTAKVPAALDPVSAGGVPLAGLTALQVLRDELHVSPGMRLLITGAAGGVGTFAVQLAKHFGAEVFATVSPAGVELARSLGVDHVIDYKQQQLEAAISEPSPPGRGQGEGARNAFSTSTQHPHPNPLPEGEGVHGSLPKKVDAVFDLVGGKTLEETFRVVKPGGKIVSIAGMPEPETARKDLGRGWLLQSLFWLISFRLRRLARRHKVLYRYYFMNGSAEDLNYLAGLIEQSQLRIIVDRVFPFAQIHEAFAHLEAGHAKGKIIVEFEDTPTVDTPRV